MIFLRAIAALPWLLAFTVPATAPTERPTESKPTHVVPATIDDTGAADVTAALQAFLDGVPNGAIAALRHGARYRIEGTLVLTNRQNLNLEGNGAELFATSAGDQSRSQIRVVGGAGLVIHDLDIKGANPEGGIGEGAYEEKFAFQHGIRLDGAVDTEIVKVNVSDVYGDFVYIGPGPNGQFSERVWIHDSAFTRGGRQGIAVTAGRDVVFERNVISQTRRATIDLEPNGVTGGARNIHILDNAVGPGRLLFIASAGNGPVDQVVVARNTLNGRSLSVYVKPPPGQRRSAIYIVDNTSTEAVKRSPVDITSVDGLVVTGNTEPITVPGVPAVVATGVCGMLVANNNVAPSTAQVTGDASCGAAPSPTPPGPPAVAGRPVSGAVVAASTTTTSTTEPPARVLAPPDTEAAESSWIVIGLVVLAALGGGALIAWELRSRRAARQDGPRRPPPSP
jgi:hypothetical protein